VHHRSRLPRRWRASHSQIVNAQQNAGVIMNLFEGQRAVVTGAAGGIGRAVAQRLAREGASVALWDMNGARLTETAGELRAQGVVVTTCVLDVADRAAVAQAAQDAREALGGPIGLLVNNAGIGK